MADLSGSDLSGAEELKDGYKIAPPGDYSLFIESSERVPTSTGAEMLKCVFRITGDTEYEGATIWENFNLWNTNADTVRIARDQMNALSMAILGQPIHMVGNSSKLHTHLFDGYVDNVPAQTRDANGKWVDDPTKRKNKLVFRKGTIRAHGTIKEAPKPVAQAVAAQPQVAQAAPVATATPTTPGAGVAPWKRKAS